MELVSVKRQGFSSSKSWKMLRCSTAAQWCPRGGPESSVEARKDGGFTEGQNLRIMCICIIQIPIKMAHLRLILVRNQYFKLLSLRHAACSLNESSCCECSAPNGFIVSGFAAWWVYQLGCLFELKCMGFDSGEYCWCFGNPIPNHRLDV